MAAATMGVFLATLLCFGAAMLLMAVGLLMGRGPPRGSCGALALLCDRTGEELCEECPRREREEADER